MKTMTWLGAAVIAAGVSMSASAGIQYQVDINGEVDFNLINSGVFGGVNGGDAVNISFIVDASDFVDSTNFPTRGYNLDPNSFALTIGSVTAGLEDPSGETPMFILRDNDPGVDGFFLGTNVDGFDNGVATDVTGAFGQFRIRSLATYDNDPFPSLDIGDIVGSYDFTGLTVFGMGITDGAFEPMGMIFSDMTISVVPAPASLALLPALFLGRRR